MRNYKQFYAICNKHDLTKEEVVLEFTKERTDKLSELSEGEFAELMRRMARMNTLPPGDLQRKKMISLARQMQWGKTTQDILTRINGWLLKQKYQRPLMQLNVPELNVMLTIFETKVFKDYMEGLNK